MECMPTCPVLHYYTTFINIYTTFIKRSIHKSIRSNPLFKTQYIMTIKYNSLQINSCDICKHIKIYMINYNLVNAVKL